MSTFLVFYTFVGVIAFIASLTLIRVHKIQSRPKPRYTVKIIEMKDIN